VCVANSWYAAIGVWNSPRQWCPPGGAAVNVIVVVTRQAQVKGA
jgi:hypothetical protein